MTSTNTPEQIELIVKALAGLHVNLYGCESGDPKTNAQRNLVGRTHYVDDDTLRWHKSRICSSGKLHGGLLFRVICSDAMDMHNTKRGFRVAVFDVFGTCVSRPELENASRTSEAAHNVSMAETIDLMAHYRQAIAERLRHQEQEAADSRAALAILSEPPKPYGQALEELESQVAA